MIDYYLNLLADPVRIEAFDQAIRTTVRADDVALDLGCGIGTYAIFAARAGARRVFAIESTSAVEFARQLAKQNQVQIELLNRDARQVTLPEPATLLIFEDFWPGLLSDSTRSILAHVAEHCLADDFRVIPERVILKGAPIADPGARQRIDPWYADKISTFGLDLSPLLSVSHNTVHHLRPSNDIEIMANPATLHDQALNTPLPGNWSGRAEFEITRHGAVEGVCLWHDLILTPTINYTNQPDQRGQGTWGQALLPLPEPWTAEPGEILECTLAYETGSGDGLWKWNYVLSDQNGVAYRRHTGNNFAGLPISREWLRRLRGSGS